MSIERAQIAAVILAGGAARRMGGGDKTLLPLGGKPILQHILDRLTPQCAPILLNANGDASRFQAFGLGVYADAVDGYLGPLAGILTGLDAVALNHRGQGGGHHAPHQHRRRHAVYPQKSSGKHALIGGWGKYRPC